MQHGEPLLSEVSKGSSGVLFLLICDEYIGRVGNKALSLDF